MSRGITVTLLSGLLLTGCLCGGACHRRARDQTWYDSSGHAIEQKWKKDANGKDVPDPHPSDRYGRPWVYDSDGNLVPLDPPPGVRSHHYGFIWGGTGYRSFSSGSPYRSGSYGSGSSSSSSSPSRSGSSSSVSRGGFGST